MASSLDCNSENGMIEWNLIFTKTFFAKCYKMKKETFYAGIIISHTRYKFSIQA